MKTDLNDCTHFVPQKFIGYEFSERSSFLARSPKWRLRWFIRETENWLAGGPVSLQIGQFKMSFNMLILDCLRLIIISRHYLRNKSTAYKAAGSSMRTVLRRLHPLSSGIDASSITRAIRITKKSACWH